jgi:HAD superfamily hydrolase (TIGR01549 family)
MILLISTIFTNFEEWFQRSGKSKYNAKELRMKALFWDFDGTLVDSRLRNYEVTKKIIRDSTTKDILTIPFLQSFENYKKGIAEYSNWRDIYQSGFNLSAEETDVIGQLWTDFQLRDDTHAPLFEGLEDVLTTFKNSTNVIISQNAKQNIIQILDENKITEYFDRIVGFEEVGIREQKPDPSGFLKCIKELSLTNNVTIYYIGDHETDVVFAKNTFEILKANNSTSTIISIGVFYGNDQSVSDWKVKPDFVALSPVDLLDIIR